LYALSSEHRFNHNSLTEKKIGIGALLNTKHRIVIAIDGLAGTGKSTLAKLLAEKLQYQHLNTGLIYRSVAFLMTEHNLSVTEPDKILSVMSQNTISIESDTDARSLVRFSDGRIFYYEDLLSEEVSKNASQVAALEPIRSSLLDLQRKAYPNTPIVAEGRDMGTVIFPDADIKFFIEVPSVIRSERRLRQLQEAGVLVGKNIEEEKKQIESDILDRDMRDSKRSVAPCIPATDAIIFDNSILSLTQAVAELYHQISLRLTKQAN
jgi:cytidylate kinase